ncbi:hypothetical protein MON38_21015 [Hymenobacter sp. DH14]|uniref:Uncharacterized protein n=1 Tax=Hymenobacter cyanobacteriorum TaxID=2926463 RepID=A0A9X1VJF1_9BACT|nr:hypothetical protein [Hymenobacter cyanobacteriorum]MCI1189912.1 hypothetical protein [Hymenobacter cyanobacteriorum]
MPQALFGYISRMIKVIDDQRTIQQLHRRFLHKLADEFTERIACWVGFPSGNFADTVSYSEELDIWVSSNNQPTKFWNGFGVGRPKPGSNNSLVGEINFPFETINRRIAGAFAVEDGGKILVLHRGKIGGGKPGIGKNYFTDNYTGEWVRAWDGDRGTDFCLVAEFESPLFASQVADFIKQIQRVKRLISDDEERAPFDFSDFIYSEESHGQILTESREPTTINRVHGIVVNRLAELLVSQGLKVARDKNRDLFIHRQSEVLMLFEVKTTLSTQAMCTAMGQLLLYSVPFPKRAFLVAVFPQKLSRKVAKRFEELGIQVLYYEWEDKKPKFLNLKKTLALLP